jgi:hypothetical protein
MVPSKIVGFSKIVVGKGNSGCGGRPEKLSSHLTFLYESEPIRNTCWGFTLGSGQRTQSCICCCLRFKRSCNHFYAHVIRDFRLGLKTILKTYTVMQSFLRAYYSTLQLKEIHFNAQYIKSISEFLHFLCFHNTTFVLLYL